MPHRFSGFAVFTDIDVHTSNGGRVFTDPVLAVRVCASTGSAEAGVCPAGDVISN